LTSSENKGGWEKKAKPRSHNVALKDAKRQDVRDELEADRQHE